MEKRERERFLIGGVQVSSVDDLQASHRISPPRCTAIAQQMLYEVKDSSRIHKHYGPPQYSHHNHLNYRQTRHPRDQTYNTSTMIKIKDAATGSARPDPAGAAEQ